METITTYLFKEHKDKNLQIEVNNINMETARENEKYYDNIFSNIEESNYTTIDSSLTDHGYSCSLKKLETNLMEKSDFIDLSLRDNDNTTSIGKLETNSMKKSDFIHSTEDEEENIEKNYDLSILQKISQLRIEVFMFHPIQNFYYDCKNLMKHIKVKE